MKGNKYHISRNQLGALITLSAVAIWGVWVIWLHMIRPLGIVYIDILFLSAMAPVYLILLPFYALRVRWSYISGIIVLSGLFLGLLKSLLDHSFFFSFSAYNLTTIVVLISAGACIYFSIRSYLESPPVNWIKSIVGVGVMLLISGVAIWQVSIHQMEIENLLLHY